MSCGETTLRQPPTTQVIMMEKAIVSEKNQHTEFYSKDFLWVHSRSQKEKIKLQCKNTI